MSDVEVDNWQKNEGNYHVGKETNRTRKRIVGCFKRKWRMVAIN